MILTTDRLVLRPWRVEDAPALYEYAKHPDVGPIAGWPVHTSVENSRQLIHDVLSAKGTFAVALKETDEAIGSVGLMTSEQSNLGIAPSEGEIGYWLGVPHWGKGLIPEAVREIIRWAFCDQGMTSLWCGYFDGNKNSQRVSEKCGFAFHHTDENVPWPLLNTTVTQHVTCLTKQQWEQQQPK